MLKYWNIEHNRECYFNPETKESIWVLPKGVKVDITDCTEGATDIAQEKTADKKDDKSENQDDEDPVD